MTTLPGRSPLAWRKSSYSVGPNGQCVEVAAVWRKSSYSGGPNGGCVEVAAPYRGGFAVRDSKHPAGPALAFDAHDWATFVHTVRTHTPT